MSDQTQLTIESLIQNVRQKDPTLYDALNSMAQQIFKLNTEVFPPPTVVSRSSGVPIVVPSDVTNFTYVTSLLNIKLTWDIVATATSYEIRQGSSWALGSVVLTTITNQALFDPLLIGTTQYFIKAINDSGNYSTNAVELDVIIPVIPAVTVVSSTIVNNVLLSWAAAVSTFQIAYYLVKRNGVSYGTVTGTFITIPESSAATRTYDVIPYDIAGNAGTPATVSVTTSGPPDYILKASQTSAFTGTKTNAYVDGSRLVVCVNTTETWTDHFVNNAWTTFQDQINAGYPIYIEPGKTTGKYVETFDFGTTFTDIVVGLSWLYNLLAGTVSIATQLEFSTDNVTYTAPVAGPTVFASSVRYVRVTIDFTGAVNAILEFYNFIVSISVHEEVDGGTSSVLAADATGTVINFNKVFKSVDSITATVQTTSNWNAVVSFTSVPNPTSFKVLVFDAAGVRKDASVAWKARGII